MNLLDMVDLVNLVDLMDLVNLMNLEILVTWVNLVDLDLDFGKSCCGFFPEFMTKVPSIMTKICNIIFWIENPPLPLGTFPKIHP